MAAQNEKPDTCVSKSDCYPWWRHEINRFNAIWTGFYIKMGIADTLPVTRQITQEIFDLLQCEKLVDDNHIYLDDSYLGAGYGIPTDSMREAVRLMAHEEGLFLDPVYSGKAFAGFIADIKQGKFAGQKNLLFMMTGGAPGLYAYQSEF